MLTKGQIGKAASRNTVSRSIRSMTARFWIETIALTGAVTCVLAFTIATRGIAARTEAASPEPGASQARSELPPQTYEGMITDSRCGAKHSAAIGKTATDCVLTCVRETEQFVLVDGDNIYPLQGDLIMLKRGAGRRVRLIGTFDGRRILVSSVAAA